MKRIGAVRTVSVLSGHLLSLVVVVLGVFAYAAGATSLVVLPLQAVVLAFIWFGLVV